MIVDPRGIAEIRTAHPMPWRYVTRPVTFAGTALIATLDQNNHEVPLSVMLKVVLIVTTHIAKAPP